MPKDEPIRLPTTSDRISLIGRTGSGKTQAVLWHLSRMPIDQMPFVLLDFKMDDHINAIKRANHIQLGDVPKNPGLHVVHPMPNQTEEVTDYLWKIWEKGETGLVVDEGFMLEKDPAFDAILMQGRSKTIPVIVATQRPVAVSRFVFSEANFYQVFFLNDKRDQKTVSAFAPISFKHRLPDYHSHYYDVGYDRLVRFGPVPEEKSILETIDGKLERRRRTL